MEKLTEIINSFDFGYIFCVIVFTFGSIYYFFPQAKKHIKILTTIFYGIIFGFLYYKLLKCSLGVILPSFTCAIVFYNWLIQPVLKFFNIDYRTKNNQNR
jgi:hypothetical protein